MSADDSATTTSRAGRLRTVVIVVLLGIGIVAAGRYYILSLPFESTDDAFIEGDIISISPEVSGQVIKVLVASNQRVEKGDILVSIDQEYYEEKLSQQQAAIELAKARHLTAMSNVKLSRMMSTARIQQAEAGLVEARAILEEARSQEESASVEALHAEREHKRHQDDNEIVFTQREIDLAATQAKVAAADLAKTRKQVAAAEASIEAVLGRLAEANTGPQRTKVRETEVQQFLAEVELEEAALKQIELDLEHTNIAAPVAGRVTRKSVDEGEQVRVGQVLLTIVPDEVWVEANFRETQLADMRVGQPVEIRVDMHRGRVFTGTVESIQAGTGARFSLLPPQNATGNYVKVVQRLPVKIVFDEQPEAGLLLVPGMSVVPKVRVR